jgi:glycosyltransferase involved in cell wall biosynthesis
VRVLGFGTYDTRAHPRIEVLLQGLREHGHVVVECNRPLGLNTAQRVALLQQPWRLPLLGWRLLRCWLGLVVTSRRSPRPDVVLVGYLGHFDVLLARLVFPRNTIVLDQLVFGADTAGDRGVRGGWRSRLLAWLDAAACAAATVIVVDTEENAALAPRRFRHKVVVVAVGAPKAWFVTRREPAGSRPAPISVLFFGLFTPLQGATTIAAAAARSDPTRIRFTFVGRGQDLDAAKAAVGHADVTWIDWIDDTALPPAVAEYDVCLGIFGTSPKALRVVPNKVFQGAAAGCALVTSDTPPQRRALGTSALFVAPGDPQALADALLLLADDRPALLRHANAASTLAAMSFTPAAVVAPLIGALEALRRG